MAIDLRFIVSVLKVNNDLERIGDLAVNIAERAIYLSDHEPLAIALQFNRMVDGVQAMVRKSLDALVKADVNLAKSVLTMDVPKKKPKAKRKSPAKKKSKSKKK